MGLQQTLDQMKKDFVAGAEPKILVIMKNATENLLQSDILDRTLQSGANAPDFTLNDANGQVFSSQEWLKNGPLLITFYRGVW